LFRLAESLHFLREPTDGDVTPGGLIVFHCRASGGSQSPVIHWRKNGEVIDLQQQQRYRQLRFTITFESVKVVARKSL
jgi:hypothetical protein